MTTSLSFSTIFGELKPLLGSDKQADQYKALAPLVLIAALDGELHETKAEVLAAFPPGSFKAENPSHVRRAIRKASRPFFNLSPYELANLAGDPSNLETKLVQYIDAFSREVRDLLNWLDAKKALKGANALKLVEKLAIFSERLRGMSGDEHNALFDEISMVAVAETAEKAFEAMTPRDVIPLVCDLAFRPHHDLLGAPGAIIEVYDPAYGTGGFLTRSARWLKALNAHCYLRLLGHERVPRTAAIGRGNLLVSDLLRKEDQFDLRPMSSLGADGDTVPRASYVLCNPPYGNSWKDDKAVVEMEEGGRFHALPAISDGQMLFMQQCLGRLQGAQGRGNRAVVVSNGSPLFTGAAGSGPSRIRQHFIEKDWLDTIVGLPPQLYFNTGIHTYLWVFDKNKPVHRRGKVRLVDASFIPVEDKAAEWEKAYCRKTKSEGDKRVELTDAHREAILALVFTDYAPGDEPRNVRVLDGTAFRFRRVKVERPLRVRVEANAAAFEALQAAKTWQGLATTNAKSNIENKIAIGKAKQRGLLKILESASETHPSDANAFLRAVETATSTGRTEALDGKRFKLPWTKALFAALVDSLMVRDPSVPALVDGDDQRLPDPELTDYENVPEGISIEDYMRDEVLPHVDGWVSGDPVVGYEIPFTRYFYEYTPPRPLDTIREELKALESEIRGTLGEVLT